MAKINHHIGDALLMGYAAGTLPEGFALIVATHVSLCDDCRAALGAYDAIGGCVLEASGSPLKEAALARTMARVRAGHDAPGAAAGLPDDPVFPAPLRDKVGGGVDRVAWRSLGGGVRQAILDTDKHASARLLYIPAGTRVPEHGHRGIELTLVLQGAFQDETDRFARGDVETADAEIEHTPVAAGGADCICLAVTDAPLKFRGLIQRIAQPFLRI